MILLHKLPRSRTMDDSVNVDAIPNDAKIVAGYVDGGFRDYPAIVRRFQGRATLVSIGIYLNSIADFVDVEPGNPVTHPAQVRASFEFRKAHGVWKPGFYGDKTRMANTIIPGLAGIPRSEYRLWLADWVNHPEILPGYDAQQYESLNRPNIDVSLVADSFFPPGAKPHTKPKGIGPKAKAVVKKVIRKPHRKAVAVIPGGGSGVILDTLLTHSGVHLTSAESAAIATVLALIAAWITPAKQETP